MKEQYWLMRITTTLAAFCAFILVDIYKDFKQVRSDVTDHKYQLKALNDKYEDVRDEVYRVSFLTQSTMPQDKTFFKPKIR